MSVWQVSVADTARVCHEANRAIQNITGDPAPSPEWTAAPEWQRLSAIDGVLNAIAGNGPEKSHQGWCDYRRADGWVYGPVKDEAAKTHPCLVPYAELPADQKAKDHVFVAIVAALQGDPRV